MNPEVMTLFRQVADLPLAERADHYARQQVPEALRQEVESLLQFDWSTGAVDDDAETPEQRLLNRPSAASARPARNRTIPLPERIGRFEVERLLGRGGMGDVYLARDPVIERPVAIKLIGNGVENETARRRLVREARTAGRLRHPNIVTIFESGEHEQQPYIAMEYVPGETLRTLIGRRQPLSMRRRLEMIEGACAGLAHAHRAGVIHLDIKPDNLILDDTGVVKVLDFGISRNTQADTLTAHVAGTLRYMSPEQIQGKAIDHRSDTFSLGCALFELMVYEPAFSGSTSEIVTRIANGPVPSLAERMPDVSPDLERIVSRAMALDAEERYGDLDELREELASVRLGLDPAADLPEPPRPGAAGVDRPSSRPRLSTAPATRSHRGVPVVAAVLGATVIVVAGTLLWLRDGGVTAPPPAREAAPAADTAATGSTPTVVLPTPQAADDVWRLLARGERAAVLARLDVSADGTLARSVVDTVRATAVRAREAAVAAAGTDMYRNADGQMARATRLASDGRTAEALRALWLAGDLYAKSSPTPVSAPASSAQPQTAAPSPAAAGAPPAAPPPASESETVATPPAISTSPPVTAAGTPERPAAAAATPAPVLSDRQAVLEVLRRYDAAYKALDITALLRVFPSLGRQQIEQLRLTFEGMSSYEMDTRVGRVEVAADMATVQATVARRMAPRVGSPLTNEVATEFRLRRTGSDWVIVSVTAR